MLLAIASQIGQLLLFGAVLVSLWAAATVAVCALTRIKLKKITIFVGKPVFTFQTPLCPLCIGYIPTTAYVSHDTDDFVTHPLPVRWLMILAGPLAVVLSAVACLGAQETAAQMHSALAQLSQGALHPLTRGASLVARFFELAHHSLIAGYGTLAAKSATLYILPIPAMPLGQMLIDLLPNRHEHRLVKVLSPILAFLLFPLFISWAIALISHLCHVR